MIHNYNTNDTNINAAKHNHRQYTTDLETNKIEIQRRETISGIM